MHSLLERYLADVSKRLGPLPSPFRDDEMKEIRAHLETAIASLRAGGAPEDEAVSAVLEQFGSAKAVGAGFVRAWRRGRNKQKESMMKERIIFGASLAAVLLATAWLTFMASMIGQTLFPHGQVLIHASEGASVKVQHGVVQVLSAGSYGTGVRHFSSVLLPAVALPFALIFGFAVVGCCSLLQRRRLAS